MIACIDAARLVLKVAFIQKVLMYLSFPYYFSELEF